MESSYPLIHVLFYALAVAGVACVDFHRPSWARTYTTFGRYTIASAAYAAVFVCEFLLLYWGLLGVLPDDPAQPASFGGHPRFGAGWCALAATMATLAAPPVKRSLRLGLQAAARVPDHAYRLARELVAADYAPPPSIARDADALLAQRGLEGCGDWLPIDGTMAALRRATALFLQLRSWEEKGRYRRFLAEARPRYDELRQRFDHLTFRAARAIDQIESVAELRLLVPAGDRAVVEAADKLARVFAVDAIADLCAEVDAMHRDVCMLVARAVLANERRERSRCAAFRDLGFMPPARHREQGYEALVEGVAWIFLGVFVFLYLAGSAGAAHGANRGAAPAAPVLPWWGLVIVITLTQGAALAAAIVPKLHYAFASGGLREREPVAFELLAGAAAVALMLGVNVLAAALTGEPDAVARRLREIVPYLPAPFITACAIAWLVQDHRWRTVGSERGRRRRDAAVVGGAWLLMSLFARVIADEMGRPAQVGPLFTMAFSLGMGGLLGYLVPFRARLVPNVAARPARSRRDGAAAVAAT